MPEPATNPVAERIYDSVAPIGRDYRDPELDYPLLKFIGGWTQGLVLVDAVVSDDEDGNPGWSSVMDPNTAPVMFLPWLSQFVGIRLVGGESEAQLRAKINSVEGLRRGGPQAIKNAVALTLNSQDPANVQLIERHGSAYRLTVSTLAADTPDPVRTAATIRDQTPAGIVWAHGLITGNTWSDLLNTHATWNEVVTDFANWNAVLADPTHT
jgi:hypothetical protein